MPIVFKVNHQCSAKMMKIRFKKTLMAHKTTTTNISIGNQQKCVARKSRPYFYFSIYLSIYIYYSIYRSYLYSCLRLPQPITTRNRYETF